MNIGRKITFKKYLNKSDITNDYIKKTEYNIKNKSVNQSKNSLNKSYDNKTNQITKNNKHKKFHNECSLITEKKINYSPISSNLNSTHDSRLLTDLKEHKTKSKINSASVTKTTTNRIKNKTVIKNNNNNIRKITPTNNNKINSNINKQIIKPNINLSQPNTKVLTKKSNTKLENKSIPIINKKDNSLKLAQMYFKAKLKEKNKQSDIEKIKKENESKELDYCTFKPEIKIQSSCVRKSFIRNKLNHSLVERQVTWSNDKLAK